MPGTTVDKQGRATEIVTTGRHDPCVGLRATPIAEAMLALTLMDHYLRHRAQNADVRSSVPVLRRQAGLLTRDLPAPRARGSPQPGGREYYGKRERADRGARGARVSKVERESQFAVAQQIVKFRAGVSARRARVSGRSIAIHRAARVRPEGKLDFGKSGIT